MARRGCGSVEGLEVSLFFFWWGLVADRARPAATSPSQPVTSVHRLVRRRRLTGARVIHCGWHAAEFPRFIRSDHGLYWNSHFGPGTCRSASSSTAASTASRCAAGGC
jgi:hypothetical protein